MTCQDTSPAALRAALADCVRTLAEKPGMSGSEVLTMGRSLLAWKQAEGISGIFPAPPRLMTATLDDGIGQGLTLIHCFAELAGFLLIPLGLMQAPETLVAECRRQQPEFLGLTVLQYDTEELLCDSVMPQLPDTVQVIVGGPVFAAMDKETLAAKPYRVLNNVRAFLTWLLDLSKDSAAHRD
jgi:methylmalonyl-CoA mutase cobalamin-binding subunit